MVALSRILMAVPSCGKTSAQAMCDVFAEYTLVIVLALVIHMYHTNVVLHFGGKNSITFVLYLMYKYLCTTSKSYSLQSFEVDIILYECKPLSFILVIILKDSVQACMFWQRSANGCLPAYAVSSNLFVKSLNFLFSRVCIP